MNKKYILTDETIVEDGVELHRIKAIRDFGIVNSGDLGGFVESENNLSHEGTCWVFNEARVYGRARICGDAYVCDKARVCGNAYVFGEARVYGKARVYGDSNICSSVRVFGEADISSQYDILCIPNIGSRKDTTAFFNTENGDIYVVCGCFSGTIEEFEKAVEKTHGGNVHGKAYKAAIQMARTTLI